MIKQCWRASSKVVTALAVACVGALAPFALGCGPSPAYYDEVRTPVAYSPTPLTSEELAARRAEPGQMPVGTSDTEPVAYAPTDTQVGASADEYTDTDPSALTEFKPALEGHGTWVDDSTYGTVWVPAENEVGTDFQPYVTAGHWTYDDAQSWVWVSDYDWGWAPFHYGRWVYLPGHGWSWIPGRVYSGAWVVWRTGPVGYDYVGWAPAPPDWYWYDGYAVGWSFGWYYPHYYYCHHDYIYSPHVRTYVYRDTTPRGAAIAQRTVPYRQAAPSVGGSAGGRVAAHPTVNSGRVAANPSVGGVGGGAGGMSTRSAGPRPGEIGVASAKVVRPPSGDKGLERAVAYAKPATATRLGARAPTSTFHVARSRDPEKVAGSPRAALRGPVTGFQGRTSPSVASRLAPTARAPQYSASPGGPAPVPSYHPAPNRAVVQPRARSFTQPSQPLVPRMAERPSWSAPRPAPSQPQWRSSSPSFSQRSAPSAARQPSFRSSPPVQHRSAPSVSRPAMRSAPHVSRPAPHVSRSAPSRPAMRSAPHVSRSSSSHTRSAPHVSHPSRAVRRR
jgi:hypothetical protein